MVFAGRDHELRLLHERVRRVAAGHGGGVWLNGEAGIGKSALIAAGVAGAEALGCRVYKAEANVKWPTFPLRAFVDAVGDDSQRSDTSDRTGDDSVAVTQAQIVDMLDGGPRG